jgi:methyl-accepting chemotaxis protein
MNWFYDLKISTKLIGSFVIVALVAGVVGLEGITSLTSASESDAMLYEKNAVPLSAMIDLSSVFQRMRANGLELLIAKNPEEHDKALKSINARRADIDMNTAEIKKDVVDEEVRRKVDQFVKTDNDFDGLFTQFINLCVAGKDDEAEILWKTGLETGRVAEQNALLDLDNTLTKSAKSRSDNNSMQASAASRTMIIVILVGMVVAVGLGLFISKLIGTPIKRLSGVANKLAVGDVDVSVDGKTKDEIGDLERSFALMIENIAWQASIAEKIAQGETSITITAKSEHDVLTKSLIKVVETIRSLVSEAVMLSTAAVDGKLSIRGNAEKFQGGYKDIVAGVNATFNAVVQPINESSEVLERLAQGDLTVRMAGEFKGDYAKIKDSVNGMAESFSRALSDVSAAVQATASSSSEISSSTEQMAAGAQEQTQQATEVASAVEEMSKTIIETTRNASEAATMAKHAGTSAKEGGRVVTETMEGMMRIADVVKQSALTVQALGRSSDQIGEIVQVIDDIADQTNLLALNAAIEAARAGEQGRGFAVVADEVRKLAERTTKATKEIAVMIKQIQKDTTGAVESMNRGTLEVEKGRLLAHQSGESLKEIISGSERVVDVITQVAAASEEQSSASEQISKNIEAISSVTQESAAGTQQIARAAEDLNRLTVNLQDLLAQFTISSENDKVERRGGSVMPLDHAKRTLIR